MSEIEANILVEGQKAVATIPQEGEIIQDGGEIDATCIVEDSNGKRHKAVKIVNIDEELADKSEIDAQVLNNNNELIMVTEEQDGEIIPQDNSEIDFHCLVQKGDGKQLSVKTVELDGEIIKTGGAIDATCLVQGSNGKKQLAVKVFNTSGGWKNKPSDWSDIRKDCPANSIALYAGHKEDFSQYDNLGFTAACTGGYNVFIDGTQYGTTYASGSTCTITWSTSGITTGDNITTPSALKAHKIWISPATEWNNITAFRCARVAASGTEQQGVLWVHYNISNSINISFNLFENSKYQSTLCKAITAKNNILEVSYSLSYSFCNCILLEYTPIFNLPSSSFNCVNAFTNTKIKKVTLKNGLTSNNSVSMFANCVELEEIKGNPILSATTELFLNCRKLKKFPTLDWSNTTATFPLISNGISLEDTILDTREATGLKRIGCYGSSSYFMSGFRGLRVSNQAPFDSATAPQINVSYTGMDRNALVQLFNDLPTVSAGQIIKVTGCTGTSDLTDDDKAIATAKGWTIAL